MPDQQLVCHLIDQNIDTPYFRSLVRRRNADRFPIMIGSLASRGQLQDAIESMGAPSFALGASGRSRYGWAVPRLALMLRKRHVSILHTHCFDPTLVGLLAARLAGVPFVFTRHHSDHNIRLGKKWHTRIDAWCARHADHVIAVSEATRRILIDVEKVPERLITVVYNGVEPIDEPSPEAVKKLRKELALDDGIRVVLVTARLHEEKGHLVLFRALPSIIEAVGRVIVLLAGEGPHRDALEREVQRLGLAASVRFLGRRSDIPSLIQLSSVVVQPSLAESFGFAALEAMYLGRPVVASGAGGLPEVVSDGETGLVVATGDAPGLARAVSRVLNDDALASALGRAGRIRAKRFTAEHMVRGYEDVYARIL